MFFFFFTILYQLQRNKHQMSILWMITNKRNILLSKPFYNKIYLLKDFLTLTLMNSQTRYDIRNTDAIKRVLMIQIIKVLITILHLLFSDSFLKLDGNSRPVDENNKSIMQLKEKGNTDILCMILKY